MPGISESPAFAVVIPMFNEQKGAEKCVRDVCAVLEKIEGRNLLIVVEDGSRDRTREKLEALSESRPKLQVIYHPANRGYGAALRTGTVEASHQAFEYVLFMDSDLTNSPADIPRFAAEMRSGFDVIKATRYSKGGSVAGVPAYRVWISRIGNALACRLFGVPIHDCTNGFRAVRTEILMKMHLTENKFPIIMEELLWSKSLARTYQEIPVTLTNRDVEYRSTSFTYKPSVFWSYLKYPLRARMGLKPSAKGAR